ncbi:MAG: GntR family transcriptional regulator [Devosiaceae bacterium]|nr:GntR family transcriptional regulator [Devosiaceae bacterium]
MNSIQQTDNSVSMVSQNYKIDRRSKLPLYHQLFLSLRDRLFSGEWKAGELFLRDSDIEQTYVISRITVRKAMDRLVDEGLVVRYRGKGTYVTAIPIPDISQADQNKSHDFMSVDGEYRMTIIEIKKIRVSHHTANLLGVPDNHQVSKLKMVHLSDEVPVAIEEIYVDDLKWPDIFDWKTLETENLSSIYQRRGVFIDSLKQSVSAVIPTLEPVGYLDLLPGQPALYINRVSYDKDGIPLDFRKIYCRGDRFVLTQDIQPQ